MHESPSMIASLPEIAMNHGLTEVELGQFHEEGYLVVHGVFEPQELEPVRCEIAGLVDLAARTLYEEGKISKMHAAEPFETRLTRLMDDHPELTRDYLRFIEGKGGGSHAGPEMFNI